MTNIQYIRPDYLSTFYARLGHEKEARVLDQLPNGMLRVEIKGYGTSPAVLPAPKPTQNSRPWLDWCVSAEVV